MYAQVCVIWGTHISLLTTVTTTISMRIGEGICSLRMAQGIISTQKCSFHSKILLKLGKYYGLALLSTQKTNCNFGKLDKRPPCSALSLTQTNCNLRFSRKPPPCSALSPTQTNCNLRFSRKPPPRTNCHGYPGPTACPPRSIFQSLE